MVQLGLVNTTPNFFGPGIIPPDKTDFAPRIGIAYAATPKIVVRGGFGIYIENTNTNELQFTRNIAPLYITQQLIKQPVTGLFPPISSYTPLPGAAFPAPFGVNPANKTPYSDQWDFSIQQELGHQTVFEIAYTGSTSHLLWRRFDKNEDTTFAPNSNQDPTKGPVAIRPYPAFSHGMLTSSNVGHANFNGGSVKVEQRPIHGLYYLAVYQWSKNLDDQSGEADANDTSYSTNLAFDHSYSVFDTRNRGTVSGGYNLPFGSGQRYLQGGIGNVLAGGWTIQPIVSYHSGFPFSMAAGSPVFGAILPWRVNLAPGRTSGTINNPSPRHWFDPTAYVSPTPGFQGHVTRNTLRGPGGLQNDLSLIKNFHIYDSVTAQFRAEAFNIMNHPLFGNPGANLSQPATLGIISSTVADNRDLQFALKILW